MDSVARFVGYAVMFGALCWAVGSLSWRWMMVDRRTGLPEVYNAWTATGVGLTLLAVLGMGLGFLSPVLGGVLVLLWKLF